MKTSGKSMNALNAAMGLVTGLATLILLAPFLNAGGSTAAEGESTYKAKCAMCHAANGSGDTPMGKKMKLKDLRSPEVQKQSDAKLAEIIAKGKSPMPGYEKQLDKQKIQELVSYLRELAKNR